MTTIDNKLMMGAVAKVHSDGRSAAFRAAPSAATAAPLLVALAGNLAALGNLKPAAILAAAAEMKGGKSAGTAALAKVAAPATPAATAAFEVGQILKAPFEGELYEAKVLKVSGSNLRVEFTEDKVKATVAAADCKVIKAKGKAAKAEAVKDEAPAKVTKVKAAPAAADPVKVAKPKAKAKAA